MSTQNEAPSLPTAIAAQPRRPYKPPTIEDLDTHGTYGGGKAAYPSETTIVFVPYGPS